MSTDQLEDEFVAGDIETDPLLVRSPQASRPTPLPKVQLGAVYAIKLILPIAQTQVLPYLNVLVQGLAKSDGAKTGYYSGVVGSATSVAHLLTIYLWGRISDRIGRIPVIVLGTTGIAVFTLLFGLSRTFATVLLTRFLVGIFSGTTGAIHSVVGEITDASNQSTAFPLYDIVSALGFVIGPLIGGTFANPATLFPRWFDSPFWRIYPYFLPCLVTASIAMLTLFIAVFVLEETLPSKRRTKVTYDVLFSEESSFSEMEGEIVQTTQAKPLSIKALLSIPVIRSICASSAALGFVGSCFNTVFVLMAYTPIHDGGLALSPLAIGQALSVMGIVSIFLKLTMPVLLRRFGTLTVFRSCMQSWPVTFASMALLSFVAKQAVAMESKAIEWVAVGFTLFMSRVGCMAFSIIMILTKDHTPGTMSLGTSNGMAEFAQSSLAALGPTVVSSLFAFSASNNILGGQLWVIIMVLVTLLGGSFAERIRKYRDDK
ncbi:predicted protein [Sparassis crispa]|uniref:Major facilitator superfamily (MFS) profile domain-containing protein n=1 Tax=Sparassis crispa TaxID=139825 RepID=A0A401GEW3_9APHY|nr:predicted protein [Sparassis crispa]GBE80717.1 predicted protein [Sparassis crispa]